MDETTKIIRDYYDTKVEAEWNRIAGRPEFRLTCRFLDRYIHPGDCVLDIGGGPGRYALYLAEKGCDVTLLDLSGENVAFARKQAEARHVRLRAVTGDARTADEQIAETFDHVLLMGPLYHLLGEAGRVRAITAALHLLKPGGIFFASFINLFAGMIYEMKIEPGLAISGDPNHLDYMESFLAEQSFAGDAFTKAFFIAQNEVLPFMSRFPLEKLHLIGQESITSPCENNIMSQPKEVVDVWLDLCEKICEREDLLSWSEHLMYIGRKL
ncbi:MAG: class I SAM-dependent methyltransferase [Oscillospiraceae bacterium]|nr:class I SAM-dependent methyltransferase [Oscillospiraceae bacterium]